MTGDTSTSLLADLHQLAGGPAQRAARPRPHSPGPGGHHRCCDGPAGPRPGREPATPRRVRPLPGACRARASFLEETIRGRDKDEAAANARWNWPAADVHYVGRSYEVGHQVVDATDPTRTGEITQVRQGPDPTLFPQLSARFAGETQDVDVTRDQIRRPPRTCTQCLDYLGAGPTDCDQCCTVRSAKEGYDAHDD